MMPSQAKQPRITTFFQPTTPSPKPCHFLSLPPELRNRIYSLAVHEVLNPRDGHIHDEPSLLLTNHEIRSEALAMFKAEKYYVFSTWNAAMHWTDTLSDFQLAQVKDVRIDTAAGGTQLRHYGRARGKDGAMKVDDMQWIAEQAEAMLNSVRGLLGVDGEKRRAAPWIRVMASIKMKDGTREWSETPLERWLEVKKMRLTKV